MAEEDEIDILGDFSLDNFLSKNDSNIYDTAPLVSQNSELLNCDYTIHPQWLLDRPSANPDNWYATNSSNNLPETSQNESDALGHVSTENCITDESGWTEKEKNLLERGIEIFGKSNVRLSQFIGSKTASEVKYYLKNFYLENQLTLSEQVRQGVNNSNLVSEILDDTQIPASIEEVIAAVSTAKPTIPINKKPRKKSLSSSSDTYNIDLKEIPVGQSLLKSNYIKVKPENKIKERKWKKSETKINRIIEKNSKLVKFKFKTKIQMPMTENKTVLKQKTVKIMNEESNKTEVSKVEITTGKGLAVPICEGEEIVKIKKVEDDSDSDVEIDIEDSDDDFKSNKSFLQKEENGKRENFCLDSESVVTKLEREEEKIVEQKEMQSNEFDISKLSENIVKELISLEHPKCEIVLKENDVTELEKVIHNEFFEDRPTKTPARYLKIRNHIIGSWRMLKPNYVTKTSIRQGLRNCGDVNCIGRIHYFLEQVGAINFGCAQTNYFRPLSDMIQTSVPVREKPLKDFKNTQPRQISDLGSRPRIKKKFNNDGEGGCTLTHDDKGQVVNTTIVNEEPTIKQRMYIKKPSIRLIYCRPFTDEKPQEYTIKIHLSTLLQMDFHAHTCLTEVMGLVAGYWTPQSKALIISHYEPCRNIASSATHCDMCPISQARAADIIHNKGLDILGWFHSHPTFAPEPSQQDLDTQQVVQKWIGHSKPCIGVILSPFSLNGALIASPFRCMIVDKKNNFEDQFVPYKFKVDIISDGFSVEDFLRDVIGILQSHDGCSPDAKVSFNKPYFQDSSISYLDKFISSVRMHLAKCGTLNKMTCDTLIRGVTDILK